MSLIADTDRPVHFPQDPSKFAFDREVSAIFENMAHRSIPNFRVAHDTHVSMLKPWLTRDGCKVMDVGASRGSFLAAVERQHPSEIAKGKLEMHAVDNSTDMCAYLRLDHPAANVRCLDITTNPFMSAHETYDVVVAHYILQFVPYNMQGYVLGKLIRMVREGGVLIYGGKSTHDVYGEAGALAHEEYISWRVSNGYTREEIEAKTLALKGSMYPVPQVPLMGELRRRDFKIMETFRFMMFHTLFAVKGI